MPNHSGVPNTSKLRRCRNLQTCMLEYDLHMQPVQSLGAGQVRYQNAVQGVGAGVGRILASIRI